MICDVCQSENATVFLSQMADGKLQKVNLCKLCADDKGVTDPTGFALTDMLEGMGEETVTEKPALPDELSCPSCGFTQTHFKKTGRFGCARCYTVFNEGLEGLLEAMHKHTEHAGKKPAHYEQLVPEELELEEVEEERELTPEEKLAELRESLNASVEAEDYEEAARLRDAISQLEDQLEESGS